MVRMIASVRSQLNVFITVEVSRWRASVRILRCPSLNATLVVILNLPKDPSGNVE